METLLRDTNLIKRAFWLVRLRWVAIAVLLTSVLVAVRMLHISLPTTELGVIVAGLIIYNLVLFTMLNHMTSGDVSPCHKTINRIITFQIFADIIILTVILHYSGGIENPFFLYFVFHMIIASILLSTRQSYLQATFAIVFFGLIVLLEYLGHIRHFAVEEIAGNNLYCDGSFVLKTFLVFSTTLYLVVYMTTSISRQLSRQQQWYENANTQLQEKDHLKNEYVLRLTHDIKGHLAAIQSCLGIVDAQTVGPLNEQQIDLIERSYRRAGKCTAFIAALLKLTKMKMTNTLEMERFSLKKAIFNALAAVQNRALRKEITVDHNIEAGIDEVYGEPVLIEETIANLLFNAVRYTPQKGTVKVSVKDQKDFILFEVSDTGIGIPQEDIEKIFDEFYRASNARGVERDGTGLGLSIARQIIERHGGQIWARNKSTGGSMFSFTLPKKG
ncbi:MAG: HAMP domain-containing histidine kinase [Sedimentisphaerales bacterium]|nr:HAMP domain-containing histidine kinase [Sedimentisphaerales bacterium]